MRDRGHRRRRRYGPPGHLQRIPAHIHRRQCHLHRRSSGHHDRRIRPTLYDGVVRRQHDQLGLLGGCLRHGPDQRRSPRGLHAYGGIGVVPRFRGRLAAQRGRRGRGPHFQQRTDDHQQRDRQQRPDRPHDQTFLGRWHLYGRRELCLSDPARDHLQPDLGQHQRRRSGAEPEQRDGVLRRRPLRRHLHRTGDLGEHDPVQRRRLHVVQQPHGRRRRYGDLQPGLYARPVDQQQHYP